MEMLAILGLTVVGLFVFKNIISQLLGIANDATSEVVVDSKISHVKTMQKLTKKARKIDPNSYETADVLLDILNKDNEPVTQSN